VLHSFARLHRNSLKDDQGVAVDVLRFLVRCFPQGLAALNTRGHPPHRLLGPGDDFGRRLMLMHLDPQELHMRDRVELRRLNYQARRAALLAFSTDLDFFSRLREASDGALMRVIVRFL